MKVEQFENKNQFTITDGNKKVFQSYESKIFEYDGNVLKVFKNWDYSKTTMKHALHWINKETKFQIKKIRDIEKLEDAIFVD
jgi:hypothetical protein